MKYWVRVLHKVALYFTRLSPLCCITICKIRNNPCASHWLPAYSKPQDMDEEQAHVKPAWLCNFKEVVEAWNQPTTHIEPMDRLAHGLRWTTITLKAWAKAI
uniref:Uncharacterized protein n=1 Tax=Leersia perrieri TaxID=77586 RepID=A0A0D9X3B0_9ORYZ